MSKRSEKHAVLYFQQANGPAFKELAKRLRSEGAKTTLVWNYLFRDSSAILPEARAIVVQAGMSNSSFIVDAYRKYAHDVEIHLVEADGETFVDVDAIEGTTDGLADEAREDLQAEDAAVQAEDAGESAGDPEPDADDSADLLDLDDDAEGVDTGADSSESTRDGLEI
jgi:hypothetical protein